MESLEPDPLDSSLDLSGDALFWESLCVSLVFLSQGDALVTSRSDLAKDFEFIKWGIFVFFGYWTGPTFAAFELKYWFDSRFMIRTMSLGISYWIC